MLLSCKERDFSLLHHFRHRTKHRSRHFNHAKCTNPFPVYFHFRFLQINANTSHTHLIVVLQCYPSILANTCRNTYFSQCNLVSLIYVLRSLPNLHHRKDLLLARRFEYKLGMVWISGSEVIGCQSPKILTPELAEPRDPLGPPRVHLGSGTLYKPPSLYYSIHSRFGRWL